MIRATVAFALLSCGGESTAPPPDPPNRGPVATEIPAQAVGPGDTLRLQATNYFSDPDGDALTFVAATSNRHVARATVEGHTVVVAAAGLGIARITVRATDPGGRERTKAFDVFVRLPRTEDHATLVALFEATGGRRWGEKEGWLTPAPIGEWYGVEVDDERRVVSLRLESNNLVGSIPPEVGELTHLFDLSLSDNRLSGRVPETLADMPALDRVYLRDNNLEGDLGVFARAEHLWLLDLRNNRFTGPIPEALAEREWYSLWLGGNRLTGSIPPGLGDIEDLRRLDLGQNELTGTIPGTFAGLPQLERLDLSENQLTGAIPAFGSSSLLIERLQLHANDLSGTVPVEFSNLESLESLTLNNNPRLTGQIPREWARSLRPSHLLVHGTGLCVPPDDAEYQEWLRAIYRAFVPVCGGRDYPFYIVQTVQSFDHPVPLVAGDSALLRVFPTSATPVEFPAVRARFYLDDAEVHMADIPARAFPLPATVDESSLTRSANVVVPAHVVQPGLEVVVEVDPEGLLDPALGVTARMPEAGRRAVDVREVPPFHLTVLPFIQPGKADDDAAPLVRELTPDHEFLWLTRTLLPIQEVVLRKHAPVTTETTDRDALLARVAAIRAMEGSSDYYAGLIDAAVGGVAYIGGKASLSDLRSDVVAHELGHNLSLEHAPCGDPPDPDPQYPHGDGEIGAWGFSVLDGGTLYEPQLPDFMAYCDPHWVSDYNFINTLEYRARRVSREQNSRGRVLLLWGGVDASGTLRLEPAFDLEAYPHLPPDGGLYRITGHADDGGTLFSLWFDMLDVADSGGAGFAFTLPAEARRTGKLVRVTLTGPEGSVSLDAATDRPTAIVRDRSTGEVRAILTESSPVLLARAVTGLLETDPALDVALSRGIPPH